MLTSRAIDLMIPIYETYEYDWMGFKITEDNYLTYHHINERRNKKNKGKGGNTSLDNGALLTKEAHQKLNDLENFYLELYEEYNYWFKLINDMQCPITFEVRMIMRNLKNRMESALNTKNKQCCQYIK